MTRFGESGYTARDGDFNQQSPQLMSWLIGLPIAYLLLKSSIAHLENPYHFLATTHSYRLVPRFGVEILAAVLPFFHLTIEICLITWRYRRPGFLMGLFLFLIYSGAQMVVYYRGLEIDCGCFGLSLSNKNLIGAGSIGLAIGASLVCFLGWWRVCAESRRSAMCASSDIS